jgi:methanethiol oxidase
VEANNEWPSRDPIRASILLPRWQSRRRRRNESAAWKRKVIEIPAKPAGPAQLPPLLQGFGAVPPLVTDIDLSVDDRFLYVSCWGTGALLQYDVSDPFHPVQTTWLRLGGIVRRQPHPGQPGVPLNGWPQMVEVSRDGRRVYVTNSLYRSWDEQFYPDGLRGGAPSST